MKGSANRPIIAARLSTVEELVIYCEPRHQQLQKERSELLAGLGYDMLRGLLRVSSSGAASIYHSHQKLHNSTTHVTGNFL